MITVKLYGLLRIESGIKEKQLKAATVKEVLEKSPIIKPTLKIQTMHKVSVQKIVEE